MITLKLNPFQSVNGEDRGGDDIYPLHFHRVRRELQADTWIKWYWGDIGDIILIIEQTHSGSVSNQMGIPLYAIYWIGSTSHLRSHNVLDHLCSHSKASNRAGNDGRSVHDLDLHGHERDVKRASKQSYCILSRSVYSVAISHRFLVTCLFSPLPPPLPLPPWYNLSHRIERI